MIGDWEGKESLPINLVVVDIDIERLYRPITMTVTISCQYPRCSAEEGAGPARKRSEIILSAIELQDINVVRPTHTRRDPDAWPMALTMALTSPVRMT